MPLERSEKEEVKTELAEVTTAAKNDVMRVLIVDDMVINTKIFSRVVAKLPNVEISVADDMSSALEKYKNAHQNGKTFSLLISDMNMPYKTRFNDEDKTEYAGAHLLSEIRKYEKEDNKKAVLFLFCTTEHYPNIISALNNFQNLKYTENKTNSDNPETITSEDFSGFLSKKFTLDELKLKIPQLLSKLNPEEGTKEQCGKKEIQDEQQKAPEPKAAQESNKEPVEEVIQKKLNKITFFGQSQKTNEKAPRSPSLASQTSESKKSKKDSSDISQKPTSL